MSSPNLFGTDLFQAYEQFSGNPSIQTDITMDPMSSLNQTGQEQGTSSVPNTPTHNNVPPTSMPPNHPNIQNSTSHDTPLTNSNPFYNSGTIYNDLSMQQQLSTLKNELQRQKESNKLNQRTSQDSIIDRFVSKKKEVFKLVTMSMTILLAISIHFVLNDLIKNYIVNNNLTDNQELFTKLAYPLTILLIIWMFKVFNR